ncbi:hypothetical protein BJF90_37980 [Pseudonocardia sp. CNS-004]|nr:hypothetical protein BJF90_37980 [Pseudonocardia sp. CNS-004]
MVLHGVWRDVQCGADRPRRRPPQDQPGHLRLAPGEAERGGPLMGVPPSGRTLVIDGINIFRIEDGRIVERWGRLDELGLLRQLGVVPG